MARVLIADDEPGICSVLKRALKRAGIEHVEIAEDGAKALELLATNHFDAAILDIYMPGMNGLEVAQAARRKGIDTDIVIMTGQATVDAAIEALHSNVQDFIRKPFKPSEVVPIVRKLLEKRHPSLHALAGKVDEFIKESAGNPALRIGDVCEHFHISLRQAARLFNQHLQMPFRRRLAWHRVEKAKHLLCSTEQPLSAIAEKCGFKNQARLSETFHRLEKTGPKQYRNAKSYDF